MNIQFKFCATNKRTAEILLKVKRCGKREILIKRQKPDGMRRAFLLWSFILSQFAETVAFEEPMNMTRAEMLQGISVEITAVSSTVAVRV